MVCIIAQGKVINMTYSNEELAMHYGNLPVNGGFDSVCDMHIRFPEELEGRAVLDLGCRRGKGVYNLASRVGANGRAVGVDWRADLIDAAHDGVEHALAKCPFDENNMSFVVAYPEKLDEAGLAESSFDLVYTNSALNLMRDPVEALRQVMRVLKPGGLFACRTVLATMPRDESVVEKARAIGNAVQAAPHRRTFAAWLGSAGFDMAQFDNVDQGGVAVDAGVREGETFPIAETDERTSFVLVDAFVRKDDGIDRYSESLTKDISEFR